MERREGCGWYVLYERKNKEKEKAITVPIRVKRVYKVFEEGTPRKLLKCLKEHPRTFDVLEELTKAKHNGTLCHQNWMPSYQKNLELRSFFYRFISLKWCGQLTIQLFKSV